MHWTIYFLSLADHFLDLVDSMSKLDLWAIFVLVVTYHDSAIQMVHLLCLQKKKLIAWLISSLTVIISNKISSLFAEI